MKYRIVSDSAANLYALEGVDFVSVPLKIITEEREYVDRPGLNIAEMVEELHRTKGPSRTSCPNTYEWLEAFEGTDGIFAVTISGALSGSHAAAVHAREEYLQTHPDAKVCVIDTLSAGAEMLLIVEKLRSLIQRELPFEQIEKEIAAYRKRTHVLFCLQSLNNLARNGRVNLAVAKLAGMLGIRVAGDAEGGEIIPVHKPRGPKKATQALVDMIKERGFYDGAVLRVAHCFAEEAAYALRNAIFEEFPHTKFLLEPTTALCSYYAEVGGLIIGFEGGFNAKNDNTKF